MNQVKIAINGFGRIGRVALRAIFLNPNIQVVAVNDLADVHTLAHLLKYDSIHGPFPAPIEVDQNTLKIFHPTTHSLLHQITFFSESSPEGLPWKNLNIHYVLESTGKFTDSSKASKHLQAGAKKVIISAPPADKNVKTIVLGVNDHLLTADDRIVSNASCTTNNVAPLIKILDDRWKILDGYITTIHSYTTDQNLHDAPHKDLRRARAASQSIIPTTTGAAKAITSIFPHLTGKLGGAGIRVPVPNGSLTDFTCILEKKTTVEEINMAFETAAQQEFKGILQYTTDPIVSIDIMNNPHSCVFDASLTSIVGNLVKVVGWYDNEYGYSSRLHDLIMRLHQLDTSH